MYQPPADFYTDAYRAVGAAAVQPAVDHNDDLSEFSDEDLLRHLGFGDGAEVADADLLAALDERERTAESEALAQFYRRMRDRFFEDDDHSEDNNDDPPDGANEEMMIMSGGGDDDDSAAADYEDEDVATPPPSGGGGTKRAFVVSAPQHQQSPPAQYRRVEEEGLQAVQQQLLRRQQHTRMMQLDSETADESQSCNTDYLFDLSEKVHNVVKISVYSVSVPYQWYTVGRTFGSNFLYLVGAAPGVNGAAASTGSGARLSAMRVSVAAGNYTAVELCAAVNAALVALPTAHPHLALNDTAITLDPRTARAKLHLDFQNTFEDPHWAGGVAADVASAAAFAPPTLARLTTGGGEPGDAGNKLLTDRRKASLAAFLGFNRPDYGLSCAYGLAVPDDLNLQQPRFVLSEEDDRTVRIVHYLSAAAASAASSAAASSSGTGLPDYNPAYIVGDTEIAASLQQQRIGEELRLVVPAGSYTRRSLAAAVNAAMAAEPRLDMAPAYRLGGTTSNGGGAASPAVLTAATTFVGSGAPALQQLPLGGSFLALERPVDAAKVDGGAVALHALAGFDRYVWSVRLRRAPADPCAPRGKLALLLPASTAWTGSAAGLNFPAGPLELQTLRAETPLPASDISVPDGAAIEFWINVVVVPATSTTLAINRKSAFSKNILAGRAEIKASAAYSLSNLLGAINDGLRAVKAGGTLDNPDTTPTAGGTDTGLDGTFARACFPQGTNWADVATVGENPPFVLSVDYTRDYGRKYFTFVCNTDHVFSSLLKLGGSLQNVLENLSEEAADPVLTSTGGSFPFQQKYTVAANAVLFSVGVSTTAGETVGLRPTEDVFPAVMSSGNFEIYKAGDVPFVHIPGRITTGTTAAATSYTQDELLLQLQKSLANYRDVDGAAVLINSTLEFLPPDSGSSGTKARFVLRLSKRVTEADLEVRFVLSRGVIPSDTEFAASFWGSNLHLGQSTYKLYDTRQWPPGQVLDAGSRLEVRGIKAVDADTLTLAADAHFGCAPAADADPSGGSDSVDAATSGLGGALPAGIVVPAGTYSRRQLLDEMNKRLALVPELAGSALRVATVGAQAYCEVRWSCCRAFGPESYDLLFYSTGLFRRCTAGSSGGPSGAAPTGTLGSALGFRALIAYSPRAANAVPGDDYDVDDVEELRTTSTVYAGTSNAFSFTTDSSGRVRADLTGDAAVSTSPVSKLYLTLDEFAQNRVNDTVVSVAARDAQFSLAPGVSRRSAAQFSSSAAIAAAVSNADPLAAAGFGGGRNSGDGRQQTRAAAYASAALIAGTQAEQERQKKSTTTNTAFMPTDTLAVLPVDLAGAKFGDTLIWSGPSLVAAMSRSYTAPIRLARGHIRLLTDAGTPLDLNGQNWSATIICDIQRP